MKILAVTNAYPTDRTPISGTFNQQQIEGLKRVGAQVELVFVDRASDGMRAYCGIGRKVVTESKRHKPDLIHVMYGGVMADRVTRSVRGLPTIVSFCGSDLLGENLSGLIRKAVSWYGVLASYKAAGRATGIVVKSRNLEAALPRSVDRERVRIIPNGIDLERFKPLKRDGCLTRLGWNPHCFHVLFPANSGDPVKRPALAKAVVEGLNTMGVPAELHRLEGVRHADVPLWLNACDVVLLTSTQEGSPNVIKEALACNVPVVSVDVGDVAERIEGIEGCHLAAANAASLAEKLWRVWKGKRRIDGRVRMSELSLECVARRLGQFYEEVSGQSRIEDERSR